MVTVTPKHVAMWAKAHDVTKPAKTEAKPCYSAWHRQARDRVVADDRGEAEQEAPPMSVAVS